MNVTKSILNPFLDFFFPPVCVSCNNILSDGQQKVCVDCWNNIPPITKEHSLYLETRSKLIAEGYISDLISCYVFEKEGPFQHIAHALKYQEFKSIGFELGQQIGVKIKSWNYKTDIIIPIPLHPIKFRERGYNQSEFIANGISGIIGKPVNTKIIRRLRYTQTQTKLNLKERRKNMEDAFTIIPGTTNSINGKTCLLVDDVITTGATTNSCARELIAGGSIAVIAASAALAK